MKKNKWLGLYSYLGLYSLLGLLFRVKLYVIPFSIVVLYDGGNHEYDIYLLFLLIFRELLSLGR
jgi:hypothetical protein